MPEDVIVRLYRPQDREAVRKICCDTADRGQPIDHFFNDREIVADLLTSYYTDFEPGSSLVAECDGKVVGYLTGCRNNQQYAKRLGWPIVPRMIWLAAIKGLFFRRIAWRLLIATVRNWQIGGFSKYIPWDRRSGHLHIDIDDQFRGQQVGKRLMEKFLEMAAAVKLRGVYAVVYEDNLPACKFFEKMGFDSLSRHPRIMPEGDIYRVFYTVVFRKLL